MPRTPSPSADGGTPDSLVVGILGGMGPLATAETFRRIVAATPAQRDQDHLHVLVDSDPRIPDRTQALLHGGADPLPRLTAAAHRLQRAGAQILCMPCNTAHAYHTRLQESVAVPLIHMVRAVAEDAARVGGVHGLLSTSGTARTMVYDEPFRAAGVPLRAPSVDGQRAVDAAIAHVKAGLDMDDAAALCRPAIEELLGRGVVRLVLGCTELSLLSGPLIRHAPLVDALQVMVDTVVQLALAPSRMPRQRGTDLRGRPCPTSS